MVIHGFRFHVEANQTNNNNCFMVLKTQNSDNPNQSFQDESTYRKMGIIQSSKNMRWYLQRRRDQMYMAFGFFQSKIDELLVRYREALNEKSSVLRSTSKNGGRSRTCSNWWVNCRLETAGWEGTSNLHGGKDLVWFVEVSTSENLKPYKMEKMY